MKKRTWRSVEMDPIRILEGTLGVGKYLGRGTGKKYLRMSIERKNFKRRKRKMQKGKNRKIEVKRDKNKGETGTCWVYLACCVK